MAGVSFICCPQLHPVIYEVRGGICFPHEMPVFTSWQNFATTANQQEAESAKGEGYIAEPLHRLSMEAS